MRLGNDDEQTIGAGPCHQTSRVCPVEASFHCGGHGGEGTGKKLSWESAPLTCNFVCWEPSTSLTSNFPRISYAVLPHLHVVEKFPHLYLTLNLETDCNADQDWLELMKINKSFFQLYFGHLQGWKVCKNPHLKPLLFLKFLIEAYQTSVSSLLELGLCQKLRHKDWFL